jgi:hypothetical protein
MNRKRPQKVEQVFLTCLPLVAFSLQKSAVDIHQSSIRSRPSSFSWAAKVGKLPKPARTRPERKKRTYDEQFKRDPVALLESGRNTARLARELG